jgi:hypothetical protein
MPYDTLDGAPINIAGAVAAQDQEAKDFLALARERFKLAQTAENKFRQKALEDMKFLVGDQWPGETQTQRSEESRPCLTINRMPAIKSQIVNEQRAQRPAIIVKPVGDGADVDTAETWTGIIRHIFVNSDGEVAIDRGFEPMVVAGKGYCEIVADYLPGRTFDQELYIRPVRNFFSVYCDPAAVLPDETDANWKFKTCDYPFSEYKALFPGSQLAQLNDFTAIGDNFPGWGDSKTIRVAEYWHKEWEEEQLYFIDNGQVMDAARYRAMTKEMDEDSKPKIQKRRKMRTCKVYCSVINGIETIDEYKFPGTIGYIPLIPFIAEDFDVDGERHLYGIVRNAKDAQRSINYFRSYAAEVIALAPKAPWVGWKGQFKDGKWQNANVVNYAYLEADVVTTTGQPAPSLPTRNQFEPPIQAILAMSQAVDQDLKSVTGIYEPSLGQTKTDQSGKAIDLLQKQGGLTNLNFTDNLSRTLRHIGRVILDAAPFIYDAPRVQRIIQPDGTTNHVVVHSGREQAASQLKSDSIKEVYDLSAGTYDVVIDVGPSYQTKRQEAFNMQIQLAQADKSGEILKTCLDIIVGNSDSPGATEMAKRLKKLVPPQVLDDDGSDPQVTIQKLTGQVQQMQQVQQQLMQHNQQMMDDLKTEKIQQDGKYQIVQLQTAAQIEVAGINAKLAAAQLDFDKWEHAADQAHELAMAQIGNQAAAQQQQSQQQADSQSQAAQQAHEKDLATTPPPEDPNAGTDNSSGGSSTGS